MYISGELRPAPDTTDVGVIVREDTGGVPHRSDAARLVTERFAPKSALQ
jgi:hypothetical protein